MNRLKIGVLMVLALLALAAVPAPAAAQVHGSVSISFFYDSLAPYGQWVSNSDYGYVWRPSRISTGWRPYMNGRWLYTDAGWAFDSYEPWGWATFHYGRWMYDPYYGWIWVPGTEWSPAWVDFQIGDGWIGWAALPPSVSISASYGYGGYGSRIDSRGYCFVDDRRFLESRVDRYVTPWDRNSRYLRESRDATRFTNYDGYVVNRGLPLERVERSVRRAVATVPIVEVAAFSQIASRRDRGFVTYRPAVRARADHRPSVVQPSRVAPRAVRETARERAVSERSRNWVRRPLAPRPVESRVTERSASSSRRLTAPGHSRVQASRTDERSRVVEVRPRGQGARIRTVEARAPRQIARREVKSERRAVTVAPRAAARAARPSAQQRVEHRPQRQGPAPKKLHGGGHGG